MPISNIIQPITPLLDIIPSCIGINGVELLLKNRMTRSELVLKEALESVHDQYDLILIDTNPYVSLTFVNAIMAADHILIPVLTDFNSHMGLDYMMQILDDLFAGQDDSNDKMISIIPNSYDVRNNISKESLNVLRENFGKNLTEAKVRLSTDVSQASKMQQSLRQYRKSSNVLNDISDLAEEIFK
jgi:chromosome partitioning protein